MSKALIVIILSSIVLLALPLPTAAFSLVPCGRADQVGTADENCQFRHLIILIIRLINYLISTAAIVAMYYILLSGFNLITALGDPEKIKKNKLGITQAVVGFAIVILAFVFVNLLVNGIFGRPDAPRNWWSPGCIYNITDTAGCPVGTGSTGASGATAP